MISSKQQHRVIYIHLCWLPFGVKIVETKLMRASLRRQPTSSSKIGADVMLAENTRLLMLLLLFND